MVRLTQHPDAQEGGKGRGRDDEGRRWQLGGNIASPDSTTPALAPCYQYTKAEGMMSLDGRILDAHQMGIYVVEILNEHLLTCARHRFSPSIFSDQPQPLRLAATSSRYDKPYRSFGCLISVEKVMN